MDRLRQTALPIALLLAFVVGGEMLDLLPCADAECGAWSELLYPDLAPPAGGDTGAGGSSAACLCHTAFVTTAVLPAAPAPAPADGAPPSADPARVASRAGRVPVPPPRG